MQQETSREGTVISGGGPRVGLREAEGLEVRALETPLTSVCGTWAHAALLRDGKQDQVGGVLFYGDPAEHKCPPVIVAARAPGLC